MVHYDTVDTNIKHQANGKIATPQVNRTSTLDRSLRVAHVSKVLNKSLEENTLMTQGNKKAIAKCNLFGTRKLGIFFNNNSQPLL